MYFIYPEYLWALFLLLIPVLIHFLNIQRSKKLIYSNTSFISEVVKESNQINKLKSILILLSRLLFLLFIVLAFCQPVFKNENTNVTSSKLKIGILWDNSVSNNVKVNGVTNLETGASLIDKIISSHSGESAMYFLKSSDLANKNGAQNKLLKPETIRSIITDKDNSYTSNNTSLFVKNAVESIESTLGKNENLLLYYVSDFQKNESKSIKIDSSVSLKFLKLPQPVGSNIFIDSVWLNSPTIIKGEPLELYYSIRNSGKESLKNISVQLFINNNVIIKKQLNIGKNASVVESVKINKLDQDVNDCRFEIEDEPYAFDNKFYFSLNQKTHIPIVVLSNESFSYSFKAYSNEPFFEVSQMTTSQIDFDALNNAALVVLENINEISEGLNNELIKVVERGGTVLSFVSSSKNRFAKQYLKVVNEGSGLNEVNVTEQGEMFLNSIFRKKNTTFDQPKVKLKYELVGLRPFFSLNSKTILGMTNTGNGKVILAGFPLNNTYTNFHQHALFVPFLYKIAFETNQIGQLFYRKNEDIVIKNLFPESTIQLFDGDSTSLIPNQTRSQDGLHLFDLENLKPGIFNLKKGNEIIYTLSLNGSKEESFANFYSADEIFEKIKGNITVINVEDLDTIENRLKKLSTGDTSLWKYSLILALVFLLFEIIIIRIFK